MIRTVYNIASGKTLEILQDVVQVKLDAGWNLSGSAFFGVDNGTPLFVQPMFTSTIKKEEK